MTRTGTRESKWPEVLRTPRSKGSRDQELQQRLTSCGTLDSPAQSMPVKVNGGRQVDCTHVPKEQSPRKNDQATTRLRLHVSSSQQLSGTTHPLNDGEEGIR